ncbi:MAG: hypothetical protein H0U71_03340 [Gammaproteobacteria bacterium]|nr:hypothetical protein [Gammaproteobacteria bacterium]
MHLKYQNIFKGIQYLKLYPREELWRLIVDGRLHKIENGWKKYDQREYASDVQSTLNGLEIAFTDLDKDITPALILSLHKACKTNLQFNIPGLILNDEPGVFRDGTGSFGLTEENTTVEGLEEYFDSFTLEKEYGFDEKIYSPPINNECHNLSPEKQFQRNMAWRGSSIGTTSIIEGVNYQTAVNAMNVEEYKKERGFTTTHELALYWYKKIQQGERITYQPPAPCIIGIQIEALSTSYNEKIASASCDNEKLAIMAWHTKQFNFVHPFWDANIRTFVICLLNRMLVQQGFPVATYYSPHVFDFFGADQLSSKLMEALKVTQSIIDGQKEIFGFKNSDIEISQRHKFHDITENITSAIANERSRIIQHLDNSQPSLNYSKPLLLPSEENQSTIVANFSNH